MDFWVLTASSALASGVLTNLSGWLMSSLKDGKIDNYDWKKGAYTLVFSAVTTASLVLAGMDPITSAAYAVPINTLISALKSKAKIADVPDPYVDLTVPSTSVAPAV